MIKAEILIIMLLFLTENLLMKGLIPQKAQLEDKLDTFFKINKTVFDGLISLGVLHQFIHFLMVKKEENKHTIDRFNEI